MISRFASWIAGSAGRARAVRWAVVLVFALSSAGGAAAGGGLTAKQVLEKSAGQYDRILDYTADVTLTVDSPSIHMPETRVKIYYKRPDKLHVESKEGFAVLPKQGLAVGNPVRELMAAPKLLMVGTERVSGVPCYLVKAYFEKDGRGVDSAVWIDSKRWLVVRMSANPDWGPSVKLRLWYTKVARQYWLPSKSVANVLIPPLPGSQPENKDKPQKPTTITMRFANHRVNTGLSDKIFEEKRGSE